MKIIVLCAFLCAVVACLDQPVATSTGVVQASTTSETDVRNALIEHVQSSSVSAPDDTNLWSITCNQDWGGSWCCQGNFDGEPVVCCQGLGSGTDGIGCV